jgi:hypothetical protein
MADDNYPMLPTDNPLLYKYIKVINADIAWFSKFGKQLSTSVFRFSQYEELQNRAKLEIIGTEIDRLVRENKQLRVLDMNALELVILVKTAKLPRGHPPEKKANKHTLDDFVLAVTLAWGPEHTQQPITTQEGHL